MAKPLSPLMNVVFQNAGLAKFVSGANRAIDLCQRDLNKIRLHLPVHWQSPFPVTAMEAWTNAFATVLLSDYPNHQAQFIQSIKSFIKDQKALHHEQESNDPHSTPLSVAMHFVPTIIDTMNHILFEYLAAGVIKIGSVVPDGMSDMAYLDLQQELLK